MTPGAGQDETTKTTLPATGLTAGQDGALPPWSEITGLSHASGIGAYTTTIALPAGWTRCNGAYLDLGRLLRPGSNTITVTVATTLDNAVKATGGATYRAPDQRTGLLGPVILTPNAESPLR
ncbi:hypothetical protein [Actinomadura napierensis]|uniref:Tail fiber protein n=1 Tax=Actinomadura napierensis TaxID=267854 RepID=A0ABN2Y708_9ACTN